MQNVLNVLNYQIIFLDILKKKIKKILIPIKNIYENYMLDTFSLLLKIIIVPYL